MYTTDALNLAASMAERRGEAVRAARLFGAAETLRETIGLPRPPAERAPLEPRLAAAHCRLGEVAWGAGWAMAMEDAVTYALEDAEEHT